MNEDRYSRQLMVRELSELQGFLELGMRRQSLSIARRILSRPELTTQAFHDAVEAVLVQASNLKPWQPRIEDAHQRLSKRDQKKIRSLMLSFLVAAEDWDSAESYLPRSSAEPVELLFALWTCVHLCLDQLARRYYRQCARALALLEKSEKPPTQYEMELSSLIECAASYHASRGNWAEAARWWWMGTRYRPFALNAWDGLVKLQVLEALSVTKRALEAKPEEEWYFPDDSPLLFPATSRKAGGDSDQQRFRVYQRQLSHIVKDGDCSRLGAELV